MDARAQDVFDPPTDEMPTVMIGGIAGRDGAAFGPGLILEFHPNWRKFRRIGFYGFAGRSSVYGYMTGDGIKADFTDRTLGFGIDYRPMSVAHGRWTFGTFAQAAYYGSHVKASYPDGYGGTVEYTDSSKGPLITLGPQVEYRPVPDVDFLVRPGKDLGDNFAAQSAVGFSITGAILVNAKATAIGIGKGLHKLFR